MKKETQDLNRPSLINDLTGEVQTVELKGFARNIAEIEWLLAVLALLYVLAIGSAPGTRDMLLGAIAFFAVFIVVFRHLPFFRRDTRMKLAIETWVMLAFITVLLMYTGRIHSPLLNLYLLPVILSALTLGKWTTVLQVALVAACYLFLGEPASKADLITLSYGTQVLTVVVPFLLAAFLTAVFVSDMRAAQKKIRILSETDDLTSLYNMRAFQRLHGREHQKAERYSREYALVVIDIDHLKVVNDTYGHEAGNALIREIAKIIDRVIRTTDIAARFGGDEFIVLLAETAAPEAREVALRLRNSINKMTLEIDKKVIRTSASIGAASYPKDSADINELRRLADHNMYEDKATRQS